MAINAANKKDKRQKDADEKIKELPSIHYKVPTREKTGRLWSGELFETDGSILDEFEYSCGILTLKMRNTYKNLTRVNLNLKIINKL